MSKLKKAQGARGIACMRQMQNSVLINIVASSKGDEACTGRDLVQEGCKVGRGWVLYADKILRQASRPATLCLGAPQFSLALSLFDLLQFDLLPSTHKQGPPGKVAHCHITTLVRRLLPRAAICEHSLVRPTAVSSSLRGLASHRDLDRESVRGQRVSVFFYKD